MSDNDDKRENIVSEANQGNLKQWFRDNCTIQ